MQVDLSFRLTGTEPIPADHGYVLYSALSRALPDVHASNGIGIHPIRGRQVGNREMILSEIGRLVIRTADERIPKLLPLAGKRVSLSGRSLCIGVPQVHALVPAPALRSRLVTIRNGMEEERFLKELRRKLDAMGVSPKVESTLGKRRTLRIKDKEVVGYEVILEGLDAEESLAVQENRASDPQLGFSRRHMGCGVFVPFEREGGEV